MYSYDWDPETGGFLLNSSPLTFSKEPRPVYYKELDMLGFDKYWKYEKQDDFPYMWAEASNYYYRGRLVAKTKGGSLYTAPELIILDEPEANGAPLRFVDIPSMVEKNRNILESLTQETIRKVYNTFVEYQSKVDVFYAAFSGGKDSVVMLDLVQKSIPHNNFIVIFGDTDMEFPTTQELVIEEQNRCNDKNIEFLIAKPRLSASVSWDLFGAPARRLRWCCTSNKTVPVQNLLYEKYKTKIKTMMITGVRADESLTRADYDELSLGKKIAGQYSFHPILEWSSLEVYLYIYMNGLLLNKAYKYGFNHVGCIMCPNSNGKHEYIKHKFFPDLVNKYCEKIINNSSKDLSGNNARLFIDTGGWKTRLSGRELKVCEEERFSYEETKEFHMFETTKFSNDWKIWYNTIGDLIPVSENEYLMEYNVIIRKCVLKSRDRITIFEIDNLGKTKNSIEFVYFFKSILAKSQYCINCGTCSAECPYRNITMEKGKLEISANCTHCHSCLTIPSGCIYYNSVKGSKSMVSIKGVNRYLSTGVEANWIKNYMRDQNYQPGNRKTDVMFSFLKDSEMVSNKKFTDFGNFVQNKALDSQIIWALILCNLAYSPAFGWFIKNIPFRERYLEIRLLDDMGEDTSKKDGGKKLRGEFWNGFKTILDTNSDFQEIGLGYPEIIEKTQKTGDVKKSLISITRMPWSNADPRVILYSLYKFAEACEDYYQFTLTRLLDHSIDSNGISPTEIFGLERDEMEKILNGLTVNYPEFIHASFTLGLDNITLRQEKTSNDILALF